jgi:hypothetical protein
MSGVDGRVDDLESPYYAEGPAVAADGALGVDQRPDYETVTLIFMPSAACGTQKKE